MIVFQAESIGSAFNFWFQVCPSTETNPLPPLRNDSDDDIDTTQPIAWKVGHTSSKMMDSSHSDAPLLKRVVELDKILSVETLNR